MNAPNPILVETLSEADMETDSDLVKLFEDQIPKLSKLIEGDLLRLRGISCNKKRPTVAALLTESEQFRLFAIRKGIDLQAFDTTISAVVEFWSNLYGTPASRPGTKVINILKKCPVQ